MTHKLYRDGEWVGFTHSGDNETVMISFPYDIYSFFTSPTRAQHIRSMIWPAKGIQNTPPGATDNHYLTTTDRARIIWKQLIVNGGFSENG
jgi:hypothetical protein